MDEEMRSLRDEFLNLRLATGMKSKTAFRRGRQLQDFLDYAGCSIVGDLKAVTSAVVEEYRRRTLVRNHPLIDRKLNPSKTGMYLRTVKQFFAFLMKKGVVLTDPAARLELPRQIKPDPTYVPTPEQMAQVLARPDLGTKYGLRDRAIMEVLYSTGIRAGELTALDIYDIDTVGGLLTVRRSKNGHGRRVPVGETACRFVMRYIQTIRPVHLKDRRQTALFLSDLGNRMAFGTLRSVVQKYVMGFTPGWGGGVHVFRHAFATHMLKGGADIFQVQVMLGHLKIESTQAYTRIRPGDLKEVLRAVHPRHAPGNAS